MCILGDMESGNTCTSSLMLATPVSDYIPNNLHLDHPDMDSIELKPGMTFTIEPILTLMDSGKIIYLAGDNFSYVSLCNPSA